MKNNFIQIILTLGVFLNLFSISVADEFNFQITELEITDDGNVYNGFNRGEIITDTNLKITSDNFEYLKKINQLKAYGNVEVEDLENNIIIYTNEIIYLKNQEKIFTI